MNRTKKFYGWWIAAASFIFMGMTTGFVFYGLPFFYDHYVNTFGWNRATVTSANAIAKIIGGPIFGILAGWAIDRFSPKRVMIVGTIFVSSTLVGLSSMTSLWMFYFFYFLNALGYVTAGPLPNQVLLSYWFNRLRGRMMGIAYVGIGVGGAIVPFLASSFTANYGWRWSLRLIGLMILAVLLPIAIFIIKSKPADVGQLPDGESPDDHLSPVRQTAKTCDEAPVPLSFALKTPAFWLIAIGSLFSIASVGGANQHLKLFFSKDILSHLSTNESEPMIAPIISLVLISSIAARLLMGYLADKFTKKYVMLIAYFATAASIPILFTVSRDNLNTAYLFAIFFGFSMGADYMLIPLIVADCFGVKSLGRLMGIIITADSMGEAISPWIVGHIYDITGSYNWGFGLLTSMALLGALAIVFIPYRNGVPVSRLHLQKLEQVST